MTSRGDDKLKLLLRSIELPPTSNRFTNEVMKEIQAMTNNEVFADTRIKILLLRNNALVTPPTDFTFRILNKVRDRKSPAVVYGPVINWKSWIGIGLFVLLFFVVALGGGQHEVLSGEPLYFISLGEYLSTVLAKYPEPIFFAAIVVCSAVFLLTLDYWLYKKMSRHMTNKS